MYCYDLEFKHVKTNYTKINEKLKTLNVIDYLGLNGFSSQMSVTNLHWNALCRLKKMEIIVQI